MLVGFDVPPTNGANKCLIKLTLPEKKPGQGGYEWAVSGSGELNVWDLSGSAVLGSSPLLSLDPHTSGWLGGVDEFGARHRSDELGE